RQVPQHVTAGDGGKGPSMHDGSVVQSDLEQGGDCRIAADVGGRLPKTRGRGPKNSAKRIDADTEHRSDVVAVDWPQVAPGAACVDSGDRPVTNTGDEVASAGRVIVHALGPERRVGKRYDDAARPSGLSVFIEAAKDSREGRSRGVPREGRVAPKI